MIFNPFANIYNKDKELRSSLSKKLRDTFLVFWGNGPGDTQQRLGLFDYVTLGISALNIRMLKTIAAIYKLHPINLLFSFPILVLNIIIYLIDMVLRFLVSSLLTFILLPIVVLVHIISNELKRWDVKTVIDAKIQACLEQGSDSLTIDDIPLSRQKWTETRENHLINQLNHNPTITKLTVNDAYPNTQLLVQLGLKLKHVTNLSIPKMKFEKTYNEMVKKTPVELTKANKNLFKFLMKNTQIDELEVYWVVFPNNSLDKFNQLINQKEIKHLCKLSTNILSHKRSVEYVNEILEASVLLKSCFEFYKIMVTPWSAAHDGVEQVNQDVIKLILMTLMQICSTDVLQQSKQQLIQSGFFSKQPRLIDLDSQDEVTTNHMNNEI